MRTEILQEAEDELNESISVTGRLSLAAICCSSRVCDSIESTCRSSASDDLRQYMKYPGMKMCFDDEKRAPSWRVHHANVPGMYVNGSAGQRWFNPQSRWESAEPESQKSEEDEGRSPGLHRLKAPGRIPPGKWL